MNDSFSSSPRLHYSKHIVPKFKLLEIFLLSATILVLVTDNFAQTRRDPRCIAMAGAYGSISRGVFAIDYNPANLAFSDEYSSYRSWGGFSYSFSNNFLSLDRYKKYNGKNLESRDGELKREFLNDLPELGWRIFTDAHFALPYINFSRGNKAFTCDLILIGDIGLPRGIVQFLFEGNPVEERLSLDFAEELLIMGQWAYSFAVPLNKFAIGFSFKYLQGITYFGLNPDSSYGYIDTYFEPGKNHLVGEGKYLFQQAVGGRGFGLDIGITTDEIDGYRFGASLTNLLGVIAWRKKTIISRLLGDDILPWGGDFFLYEYKINEARFDKFFKDIPYTEIFPSEGKTIHDTTEFRVRYPSLVRFSLSKFLNEEVLFASDLVAGFEDRLYSFGAWKLSMGVEFIRSERFPVRFGVSFGGKDHQEIAFGSGYHRGFFHFDWAFGLNHGFWFSTAKGINFSIAVYTTGKK